MLTGINHGSKKLGTFVVAVAASALLCALWAGVASAAKPAAANGSIEICKAPDNGAAGVSFSFTIGSGTAIPVTGGKCSAPVSEAAGKYTITEDLSSGNWNMVGTSVVPSNNWLSENDKKGVVKVTVVSGAETQVTVTNAGAAATLKVCKWSSSPSLQGSQYSFTLGTQTVTANAGSSIATAGCSIAVPEQIGSKITVTEAVPSGEAASSQIAPLQNPPVITSGAKAKVTIAPGANIVYYDNEPVGPPQTGYLEVCKDAGDQFISTTSPFHFTITDHTGFTDTENILAGQCTGPIQVAAGNVNVAEDQGTQTYVSQIYTLPDPNALGPNNLNNGTATVVVPVSADPSGEVQLHVVNSTQLATLKVCKYLTATSGGLAGKTFTFTLTDAAGTQTVSVVAQVGANGACKNVGVSVPIGSTVTTVEPAMPYVSADGMPVGTGETQVTTVVGGINPISFHNQAYGQVEICKNLVALDIAQGYNGTVFFFALNGNKANEIPVAAGRCSMPQVVPAGSVTIQEDLSKTPNFSFVSATAVGPTNDNRVVSGTNPVTVSVPYFKDPAGGGETDVTFLNQVNRFQLKICKVLDPGSTTPLKNQSFSFTATWNGVTFAPAATTTVAPPYPGPNSCTGLLPGAAIGPLPVILPNGTPVLVNVTETPGAGFTVSGASVDNFAAGTTPTVTLGSGGGISFNPGQGIDVVTITNSAT